MPLFKGKSKKAFEHNIKAEIHAGKPQPQALAIAYSVKRKKKAAGGSVQSGSKDMNMAEGGQVPSAKSEARPMPDAKGQEQVSRNSGNKPARHDNWLDRSTETQAQSNNGRKVKPIAKPRMVPSNAFSVRMYDEESRLQESASPGPYGEQPPRHDDEEGADRQGPKVRDMQDEHSTGRKPYAKGGKVESSDYDHPLDGRYEDDLLDLPPSEDEGAMQARGHNEEGPDRQGPAISDSEEPHSEHDRMQRDNEHSQPDDMNPAHDKHSADDSEDQPMREEHEEHADSIAAAIMSKRDRMHAAIDSGARDLDEVVKMAEGGEIHSKGSWDTHESADQADLSRNADEDANEEDQMSFGALRKENYSESEGLRQLDNSRDSAQHGDSEEDDSEDKHDMVDAISRKIASRRQFKSR